MFLTSRDILYSYCIHEPAIGKSAAMWPNQCIYIYLCMSSMAYNQYFWRPWLAALSSFTRPSHYCVSTSTKGIYTVSVCNIIHSLLVCSSCICYMLTLTFVSKNVLGFVKLLVNLKQRTDLWVQGGGVKSGGGSSLSGTLKGRHQRSGSVKTHQQKAHSLSHTHVFTGPARRVTFS